jgi:tight adherence protein B
MLIGIVILVFIVVAAAIFFLAAGLEERNDQARVMRERLATVEKAQNRNDSEELALLRDDLLSEIPTLNRWLMRSARVSRLQALLSQADMTIRAGKFLLTCIGLSAVMAVVGFVVLRSQVFAMLLAAAGLALPFAVVSFKRARRFRRFEASFPEAIDLLGRATRAGHAFTTALELIANELAEPVSGEFRKVFEEQKFGLPIRDAMMNLSERVPLVDVKFFVTAVMLQRETGGNLAEILDKLSYMIRERFKIQRQVQVFTAQGRLTLIILMALPPGLVVAMILMNREFIMPLFTDPIGHLLITLSVITQTMGFFIIRKIINIKV